MEWIGSIITILGFLITYASLSRKLVTIDQFKELVDKLDDISDRTVELEKKVGILEYRLDNNN